MRNYQSKVEESLDTNAILTKAITIELDTFGSTFVLEVGHFGWIDDLEILSWRRVDFIYLF